MSHEKTSDPRLSTGDNLLFPDLYTREYLEKRRRAVAQQEQFEAADAGTPDCPAGHARGVRISVAITSDYRHTHRKNAMDIRPQDVIDVLMAAGVKKWGLMGLHGYVGYLPQPRATQAVDLLISHADRTRAVRALRDAWPSLVVEELEAVVRFKDPADCDANGSPKPVVDLMLPWSSVNQAILASNDYVVVDRQTLHRIPTVEAALAAKYAALLSDFRDWNRKQQDAVDFRSIARSNYERVRRDILRRLGDLVWEGGGEELERFLEIAQRDEPFPL